MSTNELPEPPEARTEYQENLWKELLNRIWIAKRDNAESMAEALQRFGESDEVMTPDGLGVVADRITESFTTQDGEDIEASEDSPAYAVLVEDEDKLIGYYKASDLSDDTIETDVENPTEEIEAMQDIHNAIEGDAEALRFEWPQSWVDSDTPARVIALKAFAGMGGSFDGCEREMRGNISRPEAFCGDFIDRLVGHGFWRGDSWAPGD
jgi:hypothetical protein